MRARDLVVGQDRHRLIGSGGDLDTVGGSDRQFPFSHQPPAEPAHPAQPSGNGWTARPARRRLACRVSSSRTGSRPRSVSRREKYRTLWLYSSIVRGALAAARRCRRKDASRSSRGTGPARRQVIWGGSAVRGAYITLLRWWNAWPGWAAPASARPASSG